LVTKNLLGYSFDESWNFDDSIRFDTTQTSVVDMTMDADAQFSMVHNFILDDVAIMDVSIVYEGITTIDLLPLIPRKFHSSDMMVDYIDVVSTGVGSTLDKTKGLPSLIDPYKVGVDYIGYLAQLIGYKFINEADSSIDQLKNQLLEAVSFFKIKGTYKALELAGKFAGLTINIFDMYTNDYVTFVPQDWFVADYEEENPEGLDSSYYKSPHFGMEISLDRYYGSASDEYLWVDSMYVLVPEITEFVRPANTVPHYWTRLSCLTRDDGEVYNITTTKVKTTVTDNWGYSRRYFDDSWNFDQGTYSGILSTYDNSYEFNFPVAYDADTSFGGQVNFDESPAGFFSSISKFKLGTGHKGLPPTYSGFTLDNQVYEGTVTGYTLSEDRVVFDMSIPASLSFSGLSELVLCLNSGEVVVASTFPNADKTLGLEMKVGVTVLL